MSHDVITKFSQTDIQKMECHQEKDKKDENKPDSHTRNCDCGCHVNSVSFALPLTKDTSFFSLPGVEHKALFGKIQIKISDYKFQLNRPPISYLL